MAAKPLGGSSARLPKRPSQVRGLACLGEGICINPFGVKVRAAPEEPGLPRRSWRAGGMENCCVPGRVRMQIGIRHSFAF